MLEQEGGIPRVTDLPLVDEKRVDDDDSTGPQPFADGREKAPVEKIDYHQVVDRSASKARAVQIHLREVDRGIPASNAFERGTCDVDREHAMSKRREEAGVPAGSSGEIQGEARLQERGIFDEERRWRTSLVVVPLCVGALPTCSIRLRHRFSEGALVRAPRRRP